MTYKISFLAAALALLFPLWGQGEDISTVSIEKDGTVVEETARAVVSPEAWIPKKVKKESSAQVEDEGLRKALLSYFADSTYDTGLMTYAYNFVDLSGGGEEALVLLESPYTDREEKPALLIFEKDTDGWHMEQEITGISVPLVIPQKGKKDSTADFRPLYFMEDDETGEGTVKKLSPQGRLYPIAASGETVDVKSMKKMKGQAFFCSMNKKKEPLRWFSLAEEK
ncbi:hypothetical protein [uncultured Dialister sp.]|uniref:hypothetical protein n=1 Tax=uncultured Dialister sp. TaxID=278064 RepID=UPI002624962E|nr:hypothetical protein [uncultured Dialister sp.]